MESTYSPLPTKTGGAPMGPRALGGQNLNFPVAVQPVWFPAINGKRMASVRSLKAETRLAGLVNQSTSDWGENQNETVE
jgi:hypothetical protein